MFSLLFHIQYFGKNLEAISSRHIPSQTYHTLYARMKHLAIAAKTGIFFLPNPSLGIIDINQMSGIFAIFFKIYTDLLSIHKTYIAIRYFNIKQSHKYLVRRIKALHRHIIS